MEEENQKEAQPDISIFTCSICKDVFERPTTLACGHSFCLYCIAGQLQANTQEDGKEDSPLVPVCPECRQIIWRPPSQLRENVVMANLKSRYGFSRSSPHPNMSPNLPSTRQHQILLQCQQTATMPMPFCSTKVIFTTAFMDQIIEQQSQTNPIILRWPQAPEKIAIAGRISRPEIYHYALRLRPHQTTFRAHFEGLHYVELQTEQTISVHPHPSLQNNDINEANLTLCQSRELLSCNPLPLQSFAPFFDIYDQLNNPIYLRQIAQMIQQRILNQRRDPRAMIFCVMRVLRLPEKEMKALVESMDDVVRWSAIEQFLLRSAGKPLVEVIRVEIPGNYPHELLFILLFLLVILYYFTQ